MKTTRLAEAAPKYRPKTQRGLIRQYLAESREGEGTPASISALVESVSSGLPYSEFEALRDQVDVTAEQMAAYLGIPRATLYRRKNGGVFTAEESDKVLRFARLLGMATQLFGLEYARKWLSNPQFGLGGAVPLEFARTEIGAREVEALIGRIDYGVYS